MQTPHRRSTALASLALVLAPVLSSCGFDYATDRDYTPGVGANNRDGQVDVLAGLVVTAESGESVFIASLSNNSTEEEASLEEISSDQGLTFETPEDLTLPPHGFVNLANAETPVTVTGDVTAGAFVPVTLDFSNGQSTSLQVPVVRNCAEYADVAGIPAGDDSCVEDHVDSDGGH